MNLCTGSIGDTTYPAMDHDLEASYYAYDPTWGSFTNVTDCTVHSAHPHALSQHRRMSLQSRTAASQLTSTSDGTPHCS